MDYYRSGEQYRTLTARPLAEFLGSTVTIVFRGEKWYNRVHPPIGIIPSSKDIYILDMVSHLLRGIVFQLGLHDIIDIFD